MYNFKYVESWVSPQRKAYCGVTPEGKKLLTWDIRDGIPLFSGTDEISPARYSELREIFTTFDDHSKITESKFLMFTVLNSRNLYIYAK